MQAIPRFLGRGLPRIREKVDSCEARNAKSPEEAGACNPNVAAESNKLHFDVGFYAAPDGPQDNRGNPNETEVGEI